MELALLHVTIYFDGCTSLKEKRSRSRGIRDRFGKLPNVAVVQSGYQDDHNYGQWTFAVVASNRKGADTTINLIEQRIEDEIEGRLADTAREWL